MSLDAKAARLDMFLSAAVLASDVTGVIEFMISWVSTRTSACQASSCMLRSSCGICSQ